MLRNVQVLWNLRTSKFGVDGRQRRRRDVFFGVDSVVSNNGQLVTSVVTGSCSPGPFLDDSRNVASYRHLRQTRHVL